MTEEAKKVLSHLQRQCSLREYCEKDVYLKAIKALKGDTDEAQSILDELIKERYVDNLRYAIAFAKDKSVLTGWGDRKISFTLSSKGIDSSTIKEALEGIDRQSSNKKMETVLAAKYRLIKTDPNAKVKLIKFGLSRGWDYEQIKDFLDGR